MEKEFEELVSLLDRNKVKYGVSEHRPIRTAQEASAVRNVPVKSGVKALVFKIEKKTQKPNDASEMRPSTFDIVLVLVRGDHKVDNNKLSKLLNAKNTKLASPEEVIEKTNCEVGSVHPFGILFGLDVYMDKTILENREVNFSAGTHTKSINMRTDDMVKIIKPKIVDIAK